MESARGSDPAVDPLQASLQAMLGKPATLEQKLISASTKILMARIEFVPAEKSAASMLDELRAKYRPLNAGSADDKAKVEGADTSDSRGNELYKLIVFVN